MNQEFPLKEGDTATTAMLSLAVGGFVRTWMDSGSSQLWSVAEPDLLTSIQGRGIIGRTLREEGRFREVGMLVEETGTLMLPSRFPKPADDGSFQLEGSVLQLSPASEVAGSVDGEVLGLLEQSIRHCLSNDEFLVVEKGGWDSPTEPYCLSIVASDGDDLVSVVETAPAPRGSGLWYPYIVPGREGQSLSVPASAETIALAPLAMMSAISTWGLRPWNLALTFCRR
ncbi:MAG: hypothetical protein Q8P38_04575 [Candidatus Nanopelagicales bacterium]|nr:hypothetical protein [Candidatus Nanopelagicales bacterium]